MEAIYLHQFIILAGAMFLALLSPGPDFAMIVKQSITYGKRSSIFTSIGIGLIISKSIILFNIIKYIGAVYLIYLGIQSLKSKGIKLDDKDKSTNKEISDLKSFTSGFLCNALNPKATLFFLSMFTVVIDIHTPLYIQGFYGLFCIFATIVWFTFLSLVLSQNKVRGFFSKFGVWFDRTVGAILIALGLKVAFSK
ncbi:LysE family translocator [Arcobacter sp. CECT 8986]|uniref:LysE family translocator n=1 Tax=Arcobacter sp. CECT 8986 TaxID=2044507 RepID=UPI002159F103|nr:LysE family translocator [Arcobacter sp. CECT 8986]